MPLMATLEVAIIPCLYRSVFTLESPPKPDRARRLTLGMLFLRMMFTNLCQEIHRAHTPRIVEFLLQTGRAPALPWSSVKGATLWPTNRQPNSCGRCCSAGRPVGSKTGGASNYCRRTIAAKTATLLLTVLAPGSPGGGPWLPIGVGVHTSVTYIGVVSEAEGTVTDVTALGDNVNTAARLAASAGPGEALISDAAYSSGA